jgi:hypothetical protein
MEKARIYAIHREHINLGIVLFKSRSVVQFVLMFFDQLYYYLQ